MNTPNESPSFDEEQTGTPASNAVPDRVADDGGEVVDYLDVADAESPSDEPIDSETIGDGRFLRPAIGPALLWTLLLFAGQIVVAIALVFVAAVVVIVGGSMKGPVDPQRFSKQLETVLQHWLLPVATLSTMLIAVGVVLALFRKQTARCIGLRGMTVEQVVLILLISLPMTVLTSEFTNCVAHLFPPMPKLGIFEDFAKESWLLVFAVGCLFPGIGEEVYFRGFLSRGLVSRHGAVWGTFFAAFLFGAVHLHPIQACGAFLLGLVLQFVFLTTRSLWGAILLHAANNALAFAAMKHGALLPIDGYTSNPDEGIMHMSPWLVLVALLTVGVLLWALQRSRTQCLNPDGTDWSPGFVTAQGPPADTGVQTMSVSGGLQSLAAVLAAYAAFLLMMAYSVHA